MSRVVVVSNRLPELSGSETAGAPEIPAGGLASAVFAALRETSGSVWFGWNGKAAARDSAARLSEHEAQGIRLIGRPLGRKELDLYYYGFSNSALWPLFHCFVGRAQIVPEEERAYRRVQRRFAASLAPLLREGDVVWVNDYHLLLLARELRALGWRGPIGFFLHIPFPPLDLLRVLPDPRDFLSAMADFDLIGFHVRSYLDNYVHACAGELGATFDGRVLRAGARSQRLGDFPVGIDPAPFLPRAGEPEGELPSLLASVRGRRLVLGVDRLDYTKGIPERVRAFELLLRKKRRWRNRVTLVQIAAPSRTRVKSYVEHKRQIDALVGRINGDLAEHDWTPVRYLYRSYPRETLARFYYDAHVGLVTPLRDGMNLVAKEFVAAQPPHDPGVLVLSRFAGACEELPEAVLVNPYVAADIARGLDTALRMPLAERRERHAALLANVMRGTADEWARSFLRELRASGRAAEARRAPGRPARAAPSGPGEIAQSEVASWRDAAQ